MKWTEKIIQIPQPTLERIQYSFKIQDRFFGVSDYFVNADDNKKWQVFCPNDTLGPYSSPSMAKIGAIKHAIQTIKARLDKYNDAVCICNSQLIDLEAELSELETNSQGVKK